MNTQNYKYQAPANLVAIRSNIRQRIHKKRNTLCQDDDVEKANEMEKSIPFVELDSGLPSPPTETCVFEENKIDELQLNISSLSSFNLPDSPTSSVASTIESSEAIREKIKLLKQEKHVLFQTMKNLLSQPSTPTTPATPTINTTIPTFDAPTEVDTVNNKTLPIERSRSQSTELKSKPIIRSRSISHTGFTRPVSRYSYQERRPIPRFYNNQIRTYTYPINKRTMYSQQQPLPSSTHNPPFSSLLPRRPSNNNVPYSRPSPLVIRPSFRSTNRIDRHLRY